MNRRPAVAPCSDDLKSFGKGGNRQFRANSEVGSRKLVREDVALVHTWLRGQKL
jgi:hypothetical protein